jgi:hypothetical protein
MKGKIQLAIPLLFVTACAPRFVRGSAAHCTKQFLYTEYSTGRGGTLETHPVYGCVAPIKTAAARQPSGS